MGIDPKLQKELKSPLKKAASTSSMSDKPSSEKITFSAGSHSATSSPVMTHDKKRTSPHYAKATRCYCLISKFPFFKIHFEFLYNLLGIHRLEKLNARLELESAVAPEGLPSLEVKSSSIAKGEGSAVVKMLQEYGKVVVPPQGDAKAFTIESITSKFDFEIPPLTDMKLLSEWCVTAAVKVL